MGDVTGGLAKCPLPGFGTVGGLTSALPVTTVLGAHSALTDALDELSGL